MGNHVNTINSMYEEDGSGDKYVLQSEGRNSYAQANDEEPLMGETQFLHNVKAQHRNPT
jgi:hypothetical protein